MNQIECQFPSFKTLADGYDKMPPRSLKGHVLMLIRRRLTPSQERVLYNKVDAAIDKFSKHADSEADSEKPVSNVQNTNLKAGDMVRVKSIEEIKATLNHVGQTKGCSFISSVMGPYCGTVQRVLKPMERFVDEREMRVKKCKGLVLLEGVICEGTTSYGRCDRCCYVFWRNEWLEKIE